MARVVASGVGIQFMFDRQRRPVTPGMARIRRRVTWDWGLRDLSLSVEPGESIALLGPNGSGKTTLLRALAGVYEPDEGRVEVSGRIGSLLSVSAGLLPRLTGRENALLLGVLAGLSRVEARANLDAVGERTRLGEAYDRPSSSYSAGMNARLGFAAVERANPEVLLLDEVHEALDDEFSKALLARAREITGAGGIVIAAGHDVAELDRMCERAILLDGGAVRADGRFAEVAHGYREHLAEAH